MTETLIAPGESQCPPVKRWTIKQCAALAESGMLTERYELLEGIIYIKMPMNPPHRITLMLLFNWLVSLFGNTYVQSEKPITIYGGDGGKTEPEPDAAVTLAPTTDYYDRNPGPQDVSLVVEVSDSTLDFDLDEKQLIYARIGIPEYWVVEINGRRLHRHRLPAHDGYGEVVIFEEAESISPLNRTESSRVGELLPPVVAPE